MYNNFRDNRGGGAGGFSNGGRKYGGFQDRPKHDAKCDGCGDMCQVPFIPNGSKPVYCRNCFKKDDQGNVTAGPKRSFDRPSFGGDRGERPAYQSRPSAGLDLGKVEARLARIEEKLDALIEALTEGIDDEDEDDEEGAKEVVQDVNLI
jgi:CxxC-x17-CxxC domain-containing protein